MHRRRLALPALLVLAVIAAGACGGSGPALTDPSEILTKAVEALQNAKTVHMEATVDGTVAFDLTGTGQAGDITLTGTKLIADIDLEGGDLAANLAIPALLGMTADVIVVDGDTYTRVSLSGDKYTKATTGDVGIPIDPGDPAQSLEDLRAWLTKPEVGPTKLDDTSCGSKSCYQVEIDLTPDEVLALIPDTATLGSGAIRLVVLVEKDTLRPASFAVELGLADVGDISLTLALTRWDEGLDISAPPADQVQ
jgi:hypothetical protein